MSDNIKNLTLEDIANVRIKAYKNEPLYDNNENETSDNFYDVYILTYIKHIVRIKTNLALHGGLYSNYFEKCEEESISNIMLENLLNKDELTKEQKKKKGNIDIEKETKGEKKMEDVKDDKKDLNYSIKELLKKLIKSYKIKENKIFLVTGMLGCGKTTCVSLSIEYFNKFLQIEKNMKTKSEKKNVLFLSNDENTNKKSYKKTPYISKHYETNLSDLDFSQSEGSNSNKIKINSNEPLFNFTPKKRRKKGSGAGSGNTSGNMNKSGIGMRASVSTDYDETFSFPSKTKEDNSLRLNIEIINNNVKDIFENNDLSPLRKNTNIRNKIQFEQAFKEQSNDLNINSDSEDDEFNEKYQKIINEIKTEQNEERFIYTVRISAYLYKDDVHCIKSILTQLCNYLNKEEKFEAGMLLNDYIIKLEKILVQINNEKKHTLLIIENVEKFCLQNKQNLLYTLFDLMHKKNIFINIICLTNILDITQTLEKRIKSRFTFEMLHISPILDIQEISKLVYKILYVNLDDFHLIKKYYSVYFTYNDLVKIQKFLQIYNSTMQREIANEELLKQWSYDINYGLDIRHIYHTCVDAILSICEYKNIFNTKQISFQPNSLLDPQVNSSSNSESDEEDSDDDDDDNINHSKRNNYHKKNNKNPFATYIKEVAEEKEKKKEKKKKNTKKKKYSKYDTNNNSYNNEGNVVVDSSSVMERLGFFSKEKRNNMDIFKERQGKLAGTPMKVVNNSNTNTTKKEKDNYNNKNDAFFNFEAIDMSPRKLKENLKVLNEKKDFHFSNFNEDNNDQIDSTSPRKLNEHFKIQNKIESQYILNNVQSKFIRRHYTKKVLRDLSSIEYLILCAFARLYKKDILPKTLYVIILEINKFKQAYPQEQVIGFSHDAYRRSFFRLVDLDIIILSSYSLNHLNIKNFSNDIFGLHEPTKFPCYDIFLENLETYNLNHNLIQWVKHNIEVMQ